MILLFSNLNQGGHQGGQGERYFSLKLPKFFICVKIGGKNQDEVNIKYCPRCPPWCPPFIIFEKSTADKYLSTCTFTCKKCGDKWHNKCLQKFSTQLGVDSFDVGNNICVLCWKDEDLFSRKTFQPWKDIVIS